MEQSNETLNNTRENVNGTRRVPPHIGKHIKEDDIMRLTDGEFEILQTKMANRYGSKGAVRASFGEFFEGFGGSAITGDGDKTDFNIYKRKSMAADLARASCFYRYERVFILCGALGVTNIFDIGCGNHLQASLLVYDPDVRYTGIDDRIFQDYQDNFTAEPDYVNQVFENFTGSDRIRFIRQRYPCDLTIPANNLAVSLGCLGNTPDGDEEEIIKRGAALSGNFERIVIDFPIKAVNPKLSEMNVRDIIYGDVEIWVNTFEERYNLWQKAMPGFKFYQLGNPEARSYIFGTRISSDKDKLEKRYAVVGDKLLTGIVDKAWLNEMTVITK